MLSGHSRICQKRDQPRHVFLSALGPYFKLHASHSASPSAFTVQLSQWSGQAGNTNSFNSGSIRKPHFIIAVYIWRYFTTPDHIHSPIGVNNQFISPIGVNNQIIIPIGVNNQFISPIGVNNQFISPIRGQQSIYQSHKGQQSIYQSHRGQQSIYQCHKGITINFDVT